MSAPDSRANKKEIPNKTDGSGSNLSNPMQPHEPTEMRDDNLSQQMTVPQPLVKENSTILCIPAYNEEKEIGAIILKSKPYVDQILVCDDGSEDHMRQIAEGLGATVIRHETSLGRLAAIRTLLERSLELDPATMLILDVNPAYDAAEIPKIISPINSGEADIVFGTTGATSDEGNLHSIFMAFSRKSLKVFTSNLPFIVEFKSRIIGLASSNGLKYKEVQIKPREDALKEANLNVPKEVEPESPTNITSQHQKIEEASRSDVGILQRIINTLSDKTLLLFRLTGLLLLAIGFIAGVYLIRTFLSLQYLSLPATLIMVIGIISGLFLFLTSVILSALSRLKPSA